MSRNQNKNQRKNSGDNQMGMNTTVVIMNDSLDSIRKDPKFGEKLYQAVISVGHKNLVDVSAGGCVNAATVLETHHADGLVPVLVGGNHGYVVRDIWVGQGSDNPELALLKELAHKLGYRVSKKPKNVK